jgi:hypothetical protein
MVRSARRFLPSDLKWFIFAFNSSANADVSENWGLYLKKIHVFQMFSWQNREKMIRIFDRPSNLTGFPLNYLNCQAQNLTSPWDV